MRSISFGENGEIDEMHDFSQIDNGKVECTVSEQRGTDICIGVGFMRDNTAVSLEVIINVKQQEALLEWLQKMVPENRSLEDK